MAIQLLPPCSCSATAGYPIHIVRFKVEYTIIDDLLIKKPHMTALDAVMNFIKKNKYGKQLKR